MNTNWKAILFTIGLYVATILSVFIAEKLYTPRGANDITGPPFMVAVLGFAIIVFFFFMSIYQAVAIDNSYWIVVILHLTLLLFLVFKFMM